jgi:hypothetical protein
MIDTILSAVITQLGTVTSLTGGVVLGMPERLESLSETPVCWITSVEESGDENTRATGPVAQRLWVRIELTLGATGADALADVLEAKADVRAALLGFVPSTNCLPMESRGGALLFSDPGWSLWRETYLTDYYEIASA